MKRKKVMSVLVVLCLMTALEAGCGNQGKAEAGGQEAVSTNEENKEQ